MRPSECKYCGCRDTIASRSDSVTFACLTYWGAHNDGVWVQRSDTCGGHVGTLYRRIRKALNRLETAARFELITDDYGAYMKGGTSGMWLDVIEVEQAVAVLEGAKRICVGLCDEDGEDVDSEHDGVIYSESTEMDRATAILRGNSSESPDNSPVTADDLAAADYYEAVRQRVPWMTSIEDIEYLIEAYRQCDVMVWKAAEQVKLIFGGRQ